MVIFQHLIFRECILVKMKIQRYYKNLDNSMPWTEVVLNIVEMILYAATFIFTTAFGLLVSLFLSTTRKNKVGDGLLAKMSSKLIDYIILGPILGFICIITLPSSFLAFVIWVAMCKCK